MLKKSGSCTSLSLEFSGIYSLKLSEVCGSGSGLLRIDRLQLVPGPKSNWSYSVMVITLDFESSDPGSNPGRTFFLSGDNKVRQKEGCEVFLFAYWLVNEFV